MYCVKKFSTSIELILKKNNTELINKTDEDINDNIILKKIFLFWCVRWMRVIIIIDKIIYAAGTCLLKKAKNIKIGIKNQWKNLLVLIEIIKAYKAIIDKKVEWWSTNGVPLDG